MRSAKQFLAILICMFLCLPTAVAQETRPSTISNDVTIIIERQQVRFTAQKAVEHMQLQVFNQSNEAIFDSGQVSATEIIWPFQNVYGETLKSGLYAYRLHVKEIGAQDARVRRGHFIVDRAADRDSGSDRLWITSHHADIGAELTVVKDESVTVAGTTAPNERTVGRQNGATRREGGGREIEAETQSKIDSSKTAAAALTGTAGKLAKFTSATEIGDSVIAEQNGNIGVGTTTPVTKLDVRGHLTLDPGSSPVLYTSSGSGEQNRFLNLINSPSSPSASGLKAGGILVSDSYAYANPGKNDLVVKGRVAIGESEAASALDIGLKGPNYAGLNITLPGGLILANPNGYSFRIRSIDQSRIPFRTNTDFVVKWDGLVGIGTDSPNHLLRLAGGPRWTRNGWAGAMELENGAAIGWRANTAGWRFGIGHTNSGLYFFRTKSDPAATADPAEYDLSISDTGVTAVRSLQITGGADFAESFEVNAPAKAAASGTAAKVEAGMVVSIDLLKPGKLSLSAKAYDRRVAGVISGAGGVKPGMVMGQEGTLADGKHPVALSGRVYCRVDASYGAIKPGDLLTTSSTPGHAMKVTNSAKAHGAIIGKAMTGLKSGKGLVLVLVTLQ